jgi:hypothetical protein
VRGSRNINPFVKPIRGPSLCVLALVLPAPAQSPLPKWLTFGGEIRGRAEMLAGAGFVPDNGDGYYLHRLRLNAALEPQPWLRFFLQVQDAQAPAHRHPAPSTVVNTLDLRQGYVLLGRLDSRHWEARIGRQEILFGEERLIGSGAWGNVARSFDAVRLTLLALGLRLDAFSGSVVTPVNARFDRPHFNNKIHGVYLSSERWVRQAAVQPYWFFKTNSRVRDEGGLWGPLRVHTFGLRWVGKLPRRWDYNVETAFQTGRQGRDDHRAWAGHWQAGYTAGVGSRAPKILFEYNHASGDRRPGDGKRGTFDQLYPTNHFYFGTADQVGWRNVHNVMTGAEWRLSKKMRLRTDYHSFWLASRQDALYADGGAAIVRNPLASSSHIGQEFDCWFLYRIHDRLQLGAGLGRLRPGRFLKDSTRGAPFTYPYIQWQYSF